MFFQLGLRISATVLEERLTELHPGWRIEGVLPADVLGLATALGRSCYLLGENRLLIKHDAGLKRKAICANMWGGHFHCYRSAKFAKKMMPCAKEKPMPHQVLLRDAAPRKVDVKNWKPWAGTFEPGEYWTHGIEEVREQFYATRRIPKAILRGLHDAKRLVYQACAGDPFEGTITVHALPEEWVNLVQWCEALAEEGIEI